MSNQCIRWNTNYAGDETGVVEKESRKEEISEAPTPLALGFRRVDWWSNRLESVLTKERRFFK